MTYYLDLTIILLILNGLLSLYITSHVILLDIKWFKYLIISLILPIELISLYGNQLNIILYYLIYFLILRILFKSDYIKIFLISVLFKIIFTLLIILVSDQISHINLTLYIKSVEGLYILFLYPFLFALTYLITIYVDNVFRLVKFKEKIMIIINDKKYIMNGYMDSGNSLTYNRAPVIFIKDKSININEDAFATSITVKTLNGEAIYKGCKSLIRLMSKKEYIYCYVCPIKNHMNFNGCDALLNIRLL